MLKPATALTVLALIATPGWALGRTPPDDHRAEVTPFLGWQFGGKAQTVQGTLTFKSGPVFGLVADVRVSEN